MKRTRDALHIYIPSTQRAGQQITWQWLPDKWQQRTTVVVPLEEVDSYCQVLPANHVLGVECTGIGPTRQAIMERHKASTRLVMMDDDLTFSVRRQDDPTKFSAASKQHVNGMLLEIENQLDVYGHVGVLTRQGGNRITCPTLENTRMLRILAYDVGIYRKLGIRYDRVPLMEDFDVTLQLLRHGVANCVLCDVVHDQPGSNTQGGCSTYRTLKMQATAARALKELHPDFVRLVTKTTKYSWKGATRTDVVIAWKKAYETSQ